MPRAHDLVEKHVRDCAACQDGLDRLMHEAELLREAARPPLDSEAFLAEVRKRLRAPPDAAPDDPSG